MTFKKLTPGQKLVVDKIVGSNVLDPKELKTFYTLISKKKAEAKASQLDYDLAELMWKNLTAASPALKKPNLQRWANDIYKIRVTDRYGYDVIKNLIETVYKDPFWTNVISNPQMLRRHVVKLILKFKIQKVANVQAEDLFAVKVELPPINYEAYENTYVRK